MDLVVNQAMNIVFLREPFDRLVLVVMKAPGEVAGHAGVKNVLVSVSEDVDEGFWFAVHRGFLPDGGFFCEGHEIPNALRAGDDGARLLAGDDGARLLSLLSCPARSASGIFG